LKSRLRAPRSSGGSEQLSEQIRPLQRRILQRLKIVSEFYQDFHAILMCRGVEASHENAMEAPYSIKNELITTMNDMKISFCFPHFLFMCGLHY
jgi:hypothetical protein